MCKPFQNEERAADGSRPQADGGMPRGSSVQLVITPIGPWLLLGRLQAYHTSVLVDGVEYSFGASGICTAKGAKSHDAFPRAPAETRVVDMGLAQRPAQDLVKQLRPYFRRNTYDLLRKNCNSFSDCALFYLLNERLQKRYRFLERLGHSAEKRVGFVQRLSGGNYKPNPAADNFLVKQVRRSLGPAAAAAAAAAAPP